MLPPSLAGLVGRWLLTGRSLARLVGPSVAGLLVDRSLAHPLCLLVTVFFRRSLHHSLDGLLGGLLGWWLIARSLASLCRLFRWSVAPRMSSARLIDRLGRWFGCSPTGRPCCCCFFFLDIRLVGEMRVGRGARGDAPGVPQRDEEVRFFVLIPLCQPGCRSVNHIRTSPYTHHTNMYRVLCTKVLRLTVEAYTRSCCDLPGTRYHYTPTPPQKKKKKCTRGAI